MMAVRAGNRWIMIAVLASVAAPRPAVAQDLQPYQLVRSVSLLQEKVARGHRPAFEVLPKVVREVGARLEASPPEVWSDARNRLAALKFVATGGPTTSLKSLLASKTLTDAERPVAVGVFAYASGHNDVARQELSAIDHRDLTPSLAGAVALIKAVVTSKVDAVAALKFVDDARLLSPGSLVEESALRVTIEIAASVDLEETVERATEKYVRRFPQSLYFNAVTSVLSTFFGEHGYFDRPDKTAWLRTALATLPGDQRQRVLVGMSAEALRYGKVATAIESARQVIGTVPADGPAHVALKAYEAAGMIMTDEFDTALAALESLDQAPLSRRERELVNAAKLVAGLIRAEPLQHEDPAVPPPEATGVSRDPGAATASEVTERAKPLLQNIDELLSSS